jgi:cytochrome c biogenesis protein CcdA
MVALIGAFIAGVLTTLAPCVLPMLPVIVGGSVVGADQSRNLRRALVITGSLAVSIIAFTLLLKASTVFIDIDPDVWPIVSGVILIALGLVTLIPQIWEAISSLIGLQARTTKNLASANATDGVTGQILTGAALGPVFSSCSPLYGYVIVTAIPASFSHGLLLLVVYCIGLSGTLLLVALAGQRVIGKLGWAADSHGWFRRAMGLIFVLVGVGVLLGFDKDIQTWVLENSPIAPWELDKGFIPE